MDIINDMIAIGCGLAIEHEDLQAVRGGQNHLRKRRKILNICFPNRLAPVGIKPGTE